MILYYAMGTGLGHLTRARAVIHTLNLAPDVTILTDSQCEVGLFNTVRMPADLREGREDAADWVRAKISELKADEFYLDAFPCGLYGEFDRGFWATAAGDVKVTYLARLLRFERYRTIMPDKPINLTRTLVFEELTADHRQYVEAQSGDVRDFGELKDPPEDCPQVALELLQQHPDFWLVVHCGSKDELKRLVDYARQLQQDMQDETTILVVSNYKIAHEHVICESFYRADSLFSAARKIVTAGGFNSMRQLKRYSEKHFFLPFERFFDDQYTRAARRLCAIITEVNGACAEDRRLARIWQPLRNDSVVTSLTDEGFAELYESRTGAVCTLPPLGALIWELSDGVCSFAEISDVVRETVEDSGGEFNQSVIEGLASVILQMTDRGFLSA